jgi:hypothetical protein
MVPLSGTFYRIVFEKYLDSALNGVLSPKAGFTMMVSRLFTVHRQHKPPQSRLTGTWATMMMRGFCVNSR